MNASLVGATRLEAAPTLILIWPIPAVTVPLELRDRLALTAEVLTPHQVFEFAAEVVLTTLAPLTNLLFFACRADAVLDFLLALA